MTWQNISISRFGGPEVMELTEQATIPDPGPDEVRIKVLAAGTGFTDIFIRRGRYPDYKGPVPFTPGYDIVGTVDKLGPGVAELHKGQMVADLCVVGGDPNRNPAGVFLVPSPMASIRPRRSYPAGLPNRLPDAHPLPPPVPGCHDPRDRGLGHGRHGAARSGAAFWSQRHRYLLCRQHGRGRNFGAKAVDYRDGDFVEAVRKLTAAQPNAHNGRAGVDAAFDAIGGAHFARSFACLASGGLLVGYGSQTMADGREGLLSAGLGLARLHLWGAFRFLFGGRRAVGTASPRDERSNRRSSRPTWPHCLAYCATAPSIPSSSIAYRWRPPAKSIPASTAADWAARSFSCPGPCRYRILALPPRGSVTHPSRRHEVGGSNGRPVSAPFRADRGGVTRTQFRLRGRALSTRAQAVAMAPV